MNIACACPACHAGIYQTSIEESSSVTYPVQKSIGIHKERFRLLNKMPARDLMFGLSKHRVVCKKNFPRRLGVAIVVVGLAMSCVAWAYRDLFLTFAILLQYCLARCGPILRCPRF